MILKLVLKYQQICHPVVKTYESTLLLGEEEHCEGLDTLMYKILWQILQASEGKGR